MSKAGLPIFLNNSPLDRCDQILWLIKHSNLNFCAEETPFSLNVTIRKKFLNRWSSSDVHGVEASDHANSVQDDAQLKEDQKVLLKKLDKARHTAEAQDIKIAGLTNQLRMFKSQIQNAAVETVKGEAISEEKRQLQIKHEKVCSDVKNLKQENADLRKDLGSTQVALKSARKGSQEISKEFEKDILVLNKKVESLQEYKTTKTDEEKELKQKLKKAEKKMKKLDEKEAKLKVETEQLARSKIKSQTALKCDSETDEKIQGEANNNQVDKAQNEDSDRENSPSTSNESPLDQDATVVNCEVSDNVLEMDANQLGILLNQIVDNHIHRSKMAE